MKKMLAVLLCVLLLPAAGLAAGADTSTSASRLYYESSSLTLEELSVAMAQSQGSCTIATVNEDGTPLLVAGSPAMLNLTHITFGWNFNVTKANTERTGKAMLCYYLFDAEGVSKADRHKGARLKLELETDEAVLKELKDAYPSLPPYATIMKIVELLPLG